MKSVRLSVRAALGGLTGAGVVAAHHLGYFFAVPDARHRHELLEHTGHGQWPLVVAVGLGLLLAGLAHYGRATYRAAEPASVGFLRTAMRLAALQTAGFLLLEAAERFVIGAGVLSIAGEPAVHAGLIVQTIVALAGAAILMLFARAVVSLRNRRRSRTRRRPASVLRPASFVAGCAVRHACGGGTLRGPPTMSLP